MKIAELADLPAGSKIRFVAAYRRAVRKGILFSEEMKRTERKSNGKSTRCGNHDHSNCFQQIDFFP